MLWPEYIHTECSKLRVYPAPGVHVLAARCMISKAVHPADAPFFQIFSIYSC